MAMYGYIGLYRLMHGYVGSLACEQALPLKGLVTSQLTSYQALQRKSLFAGYRLMYGFVRPV